MGDTDRTTPMKEQVNDSAFLEKVEINENDIAELRTRLSEISDVSQAVKAVIAVLNLPNADDTVDNVITRVVYSSRERGAIDVEKVIQGLRDRRKRVLKALTSG